MRTWQRLRKNPKLWDKFFIREKIIRLVREYFAKEKFHEVETPLLLPSVIPESYLEIFETNLLDRNRKKRKMFLSTSPETALKKLIAAGLGNCYSLTRSFRNMETGSSLHNPEFTILEWYRVPSTYFDIMKDCENLVTFIGKNLKKFPQLEYQNKKINLSPPWEKISVIQAFEKYSGIAFDDITSRNKEMFPAGKIDKFALKKGYFVQKENTWEEIFNQIFLNEVEPHLGNHGRPAIVYDYPRPMAAIAKIKAADPRLAQRFEFYIAGLELGDCYNESTDVNYLKQRYQEELNLIKKKNKTIVTLDQDFLQAMTFLKKPYSGVAVGVDRLVMLFTDSKTIQETLLFPLTDMLSV